MAAQTPDSANAVAVDPPDKVYSTGGLANDPAVERSLPKIPEYRAFLPEKVDLSNRMPAVGDQGQLGSCGAWAVAYAARSYYTETQESRDIQKPSNLPSPNYVYHLARPGNCADGTNVDRVVAVLKQGSLSLADFPYTDACVPPAPASEVARAHDFRVRGYSQVNIGRPDDIRGQLARGNPVIIRFFVSTAFQKLRNATTFAEPAPPPGDKLTGWHFITLVGYDEHRQAFRLINSWSPRWGDHGYAWMSYDLLKTTRISAAYALDVGPAKPPTHRQRTAAAVTAAIASAGAAIAAAGTGTGRYRPCNCPTCRRCHAPASSSRREATNRCCPVTSAAMTTSTGSN